MDKTVEMQKTIRMRSKAWWSRHYSIMHLYILCHLIHSKILCSEHYCLQIKKQSKRTQLCALDTFSSVAHSCSTLCDPMNCSMPGLPVHHQLPELAQTPIHRVSDDIQLSHSLSSRSPPAFSLSQHQGLFDWVSSSPQMAKVLEFQYKVLEFQPQHQSFQWIFRTDFL